MSQPNYQPVDDGHTHINVYSKGATRLGRALSNFARLPFEHPLHGWFRSVEAYWYYASTGFNFDELRELSGFQAKQVGRTLPKQKIDEEAFRSLIRVALNARFQAHPWLRDELRRTDLPLTHYYFWGDRTNPKVMTPGSFWVIEHLEYCRQHFQCQGACEALSV